MMASGGKPVYATCQEIDIEIRWLRIGDVTLVGNDINDVRFTPCTETYLGKIKRLFNEAMDRGNREHQEFIAGRPNSDVRKDL